MKRISFLIVLIFCCENAIFAQQYVSTEQSYKNILIELLTGRSCPACPTAHETANELMRKYAGRISLIDIHEYFAPDTYPNFKTEDGQILSDKLDVMSIPHGFINRKNNHGVPRWEYDIYDIHKQEAVCNVGGMVVIDELANTATITVEVYYTQDSDVDVNYLTIAMLQDSVWGSQSGCDYNPEQCVDGNYCHNNTLRDIITSTWGDEISPTKEGTLITKTYTYDIPKIIGDPNGIDVVIDNLEFVSFVAKSNSAGEWTPTIMNVCDLPVLIGSQSSLFPYLYKITERQNFTCSNNKTFVVDVMNRGLDELSSMKILVEIDNGEIVEYEWNGNITSYSIGHIEIDIDMPIGTHEINFNIVEANGVAVNTSKSIAATCEEFNAVVVNDKDDEIVLELMQDKFGNETRWEIVNDNNEVLALGGPYEHLFGQSSSTELHEIPLKLPINQCMKFTIYDAVGNGICCEHGDGYYRIIDGNGNIVIEGDGNFGLETSHVFSVEIRDDLNENNEEMFKIYPNPATDVIKLSAVGSEPLIVKIHNYLGILIEEIEVNADEIEINVSAYNSGIYFMNIQTNNGCVIKKVIVN